MKHDPVAAAYRTIDRLKRMGEIGHALDARHRESFCPDCKTAFRWIAGEPRCQCPDPKPVPA